MTDDSKRSMARRYVAKAKKAGREPTEQGRKILETCLKLHGSVLRTARLADVSYATLRDRIYGAPASIHNDTIEKLERVGIPRALLMPS